MTERTSGVLSVGACPGGAWGRSSHGVRILPRRFWRGQRVAMGSSRTSRVAAARRDPPPPRSERGRRIRFPRALRHGDLRSCPVLDLRIMILSPRAWSNAKILDVERDELRAPQGGGEPRAAAAPGRGGRRASRCRSAGAAARAGRAQAGGGASQNHGAGFGLPSVSGLLVLDVSRCALVCAPWRGAWRCRGGKRRSPRLGRSRRLLD
jgi:hypothetical protein